MEKKMEHEMDTGVIYDLGYIGGILGAMLGYLERKWNYYCGFGVCCPSCCLELCGMCKGYMSLYLRAQLRKKTCSKANVSTSGRFQLTTGSRV